MSKPPTLSQELARFAVRISPADMPDAVRSEAPRAFLNWVGCTIGGARESATKAAVSVALASGGAPHATLLGHGERTDMANAAFVNCLASSVLSFDDTHLATVTHPTGPVAAALLAWSEREVVSGADFMAALAVGIEIECRVSNMLLLPPAVPNIGLFVTGLSGPMGAAAALGCLMHLDETRMGRAIGLAASQAAGLRATHGSEAAFLVPAQAARAGLQAATLAQAGLTCTATMLEAANGFAGVFSPKADPREATEGLGQRWEMLANAYKPYPCGIVIHPVVDACLEIAECLPAGAKVVSASLRLNPLALALTARRTPANPTEAQISLFHWAAAVLLRGTAGPEVLDRSCIDDPGVAALRDGMEAEGDASLDRDAAAANVVLSDGRTLTAQVAHARGSSARPMSDEELDGKFDRLVEPALGAEQGGELRRICRTLITASDVGKAICGAVGHSSFQQS